METEEIETGKATGFYKPEPKAKLPEVPDLSSKGAPPRRGDPFILTDFRGVDANQNV